MAKKYVDVHKKYFNEICNVHRNIDCDSKSRGEEFGNSAPLQNQMKMQIFSDMAKDTF
jgi:hypothetical protein